MSVDWLLTGCRVFDLLCLNDSGSLDYCVFLLCESEFFLLINQARFCVMCDCFYKTVSSVAYTLICV